MNKKRNTLILIVAALAVLALSACAPTGSTVGRLPSGTPSGTETPASGPRICTVMNEGKPYEVEAGKSKKFDIDGGELTVTVSADCASSSSIFFSNTSVPPATATPGITPSSEYTGTAKCINPGDLAVMVTSARNDPYALINALDARPEKVDHPVAGWSNTGAAMVWTGSYIPDPTYGGKVRQVLVDGKTGTYMQMPGTSVTWQSAGGSINICESASLIEALKQAFPQLFATGTTGAVPPPARTPEGPTCIETAKIVGLINTNKANADAVFVKLDEIADQTPTARLRTEGPAKYNVENSKAILWVKTGEISGSVLELHRNDSKSVYMSTKDGEVNLSYAHSGLRLCTPLNPAESFPWWGK